MIIIIVIYAGNHALSTGATLKPIYFVIILACMLALFCAGVWNAAKTGMDERTICAEETAALERESNIKQGAAIHLLNAALTNTDIGSIVDAPTVTVCVYMDGKLARIAKDFCDDGATTVIFKVTHDNNNRPLLELLPIIEE